MHSEIEVEIVGHVKITNPVTGEVLLDQDNAIHTINMPRVLARGLAKNPNNYIAKISLGNGGSYTSGTSQNILKPPNDGTNGGSWQDQIYNPIYSIIVDATNPEFSSVGGTGVTSQEVGTSSNVIITAYLDQNVPAAETTTNTTTNTTFNFNELGLFSTGLPLAATHGVSSVFVGNMISTNPFPIVPNSVLTLTVTVDSVQYSCTITVPQSGTGANSGITFGDFCQGFNTGSWITAGTPVNNYLYAYISDFSYTYSTLLGAPNSEGYLIFESKSIGSTSNVTLSCTPNSTLDFFNTLTQGVCGYVNINQSAGSNAGVQNDNPELYSTCPEPISQEAQRLLTHLVFNPILKSSNIALLIVYTLTITVTESQDTTISQVLNVPPASPTPSATITVTPTPSGTPVITPTVTLTPTMTLTISPTITQTPASTPPPTYSPTPTLTPTVTATISVTPSLTPTLTITPTVTPTISVTPTLTITPTI